MYNYRWQKKRDVFLKANPLCVFCLENNKTVAATVVDHITPHNGDKDLFNDVNNYQALCATHHASTKQAIENGKDVKAIGLDGWPQKKGD